MNQGSPTSTATATAMGKMKEILPTSPIVSSCQYNWDNIFLAHYQQPKCEVPKHDLTQHTFTISTDPGNPSLIECRLDNHLKKYYFREGDIIFCPAGVSKSIVWEQSNSCLLLALEPQLVEQVADESINVKDIAFPPQFKVVDPLIQHLSYALKSELDSGCPSGHLYVESAAVMLAVHLLKTNSSFRQATQKYTGGLPLRKLAEVTEYIDEYLAENIGLSELSQVANMSQYHFARLFKQSVGVTPHQYLIQQRIERAKKLLQQGRLSIADIALHCGFANQGHLGYHFKRLTGTTPKAFANSSKNL